MNVSRRGLFGILAAGASAAIIRTPGLLMPIKPLDSTFTLTWSEPSIYSYRLSRATEQTLFYGDVDAAPVQFTGLATFYSAPAAGDTLTLNGRKYDFVSGNA